MNPHRIRELFADALTEPAPVSPPAADDVVAVTGSQGDWQLTVNGAPYQVKGLTWGPPAAEAAEKLPDVASMGVNTIRTWGTDASSKPLLDAAADNGLRVIAGFWLQPGGGPGSGGCVDYLTDTAYKNEMLTEFPKWVDTYKSHPGVLMWNVGNESVLGLQNCYSGDTLEKQRDAYTSFVNDVARKIHEVDPNHPVTSTDAWTGAWPYYQRNAPDLDLYAVNAYKDVCGVRSAWEQGGYDKPYIVTEAGPAGEWEVPDDANGRPEEPTDQEKAEGYTDAWNCVTGHDGVALGATLFHYGEEDDFGGVWFNIIPGDNKRLGYYSIAETWGADISGMNQPPRIEQMDVPDSTGVATGETFTVSVDATDPDGDPIDYTVMQNSKYIDGAGGTEEADVAETGDGTFEVTAPETPGVGKCYVFAEDGQGNVGVETRSVRVVPEQVPGTNIAEGTAAEASSFDPWNGNYTAGQAVDGDLSTRWASEWGETAWLQVDLGSVQSFDHVQLVWESAYGTDYDVQVSDDGSSWTTVESVTGGDGGVDTLEVSGTGRYVRLDLTGRGTDWGYSLYELGIYQG